MAKYDYKPLQDTAVRLIERFGKAVTLEKPDGTPFSGTAVIDSVDERDRPEDVTKTEIKRVLLSINIDGVPQLGDFIVDDGTAFAVEQVSLIKPGDTLMYYDVVIGK